MSEKEATIRLADVILAMAWDAGALGVRISLSDYGTTLVEHDEEGSYVNSTSINIPAFCYQPLRDRLLKLAEMQKPWWQFWKARKSEGTLTCERAGRSRKAKVIAWSQNGKEYLTVSLQY